jgi:general secretion pathway protein A
MHWQHYGLREAPFSITPDPSYIFYSDIHKQVFYELLYGVKTRKGFMELIGPVGAGKTTLYRALLQTLGSEAKTALVLNPSLSPVQLLQTIVEDFEIEPDKKNRKGLFDALNSFLLKTDLEGSTAVLIIDEAQDLTARTLEQIRLLSNFETNKTKLLQIILVGATGTAGPAVAKEPEAAETAHHGIGQPRTARTRRNRAVHRSSHRRRRRIRHARI